MSAYTDYPAFTLFLPFHYLICEFPFEPPPPHIFPFPFLRRVNQINKYSCKQLIDFPTRRGACVIRKARSADIPQYLVSADCRCQIPNTEGFNDGMSRLWIQQEADSKHTKLHMLTGESSHERGELCTPELKSILSDSHTPPTAAAHTWDLNWRHLFISISVL